MTSFSLMPSERRRRRRRASRRYYTDSSTRGKRGLRRELVGWLIEGRRTVPPWCVGRSTGSGKGGFTTPRRLFRERDGTPASSPRPSHSLPSIPSASSVGAIDSAAGCISTVQGWRYEPARPYARYRVAPRSNGFGNIYFSAEKYTGRLELSTLSTL